MQPYATNTSVGQGSIPATSSQQHNHGYNTNIPHPAHQQMTRDHRLDTLLRRTWRAGPYSYEIAMDGSFVPDNKETLDAHGGICDVGAALFEALRHPNNHAAPSQSVRSKDPKPWKNVAITEQDDAEFEELKATMLERMNAVEEIERQMYHGHGQGYGQGYEQSHGQEYGQGYMQGYGQGYEGMPMPYQMQPQAYYPWQPPQAPERQ